MAASTEPQTYPGIGTASANNLGKHGSLLLPQPIFTHLCCAYTSSQPQGLAFASQPCRRLPAEITASVEEVLAFVYRPHLGRARVLVLNGQWGCAFDVCSKLLQAADLRVSQFAGAHIDLWHKASPPIINVRMPSSALEAHAHSVTRGACFSTCVQPALRQCLCYRRVDFGQTNNNTSDTKDQTLLAPWTFYQQFLRLQASRGGPLAACTRGHLKTCADRILPFWCPHRVFDNKQLRPRRTQGLAKGSEKLPTAGVDGFQHLRVHSTLADGVN